ncbi:IpaD/SipD/SspD family type III secretion system needle tip protein [Pseudomonas agarici]|uniref:IpaD/SipD/SspD family type III secretion system needle tip protein n=2 Tax=Pseudomonas agarici TaxID=46677 RepID=UPI0008D2A9A5|nr:IpaD/SipD/SspD family type III secretion system needle tip protein [Pseudomonas agarici]NWB92877.1 IpaD/SipD/SspD family type III secretion system needle tip protein [Pseudomonas agarici]NWC09144.1 IpaD/SipD/SspD family type III secretion system needle tip protein [Pseudomonas agarici]SEK33348.1 type III secretion system translocon protein, IpaD/SipD family [Pseudomonas agarici]
MNDLGIRHYAASSFLHLEDVESPQTPVRHESALTAHGGQTLAGSPEDMRKRLEGAVEELINATDQEEREFRQYKYDLALKDMAQQAWRKEQQQIRGWIRLSEQVADLPRNEELRQWQGQAITALIEQLDREPEIAGLGAKKTEEFPDFFDKLIELIGIIGNDYLKVYEHIVATYSGFFKAFNEQITSKLHEWIKGANEGKDVELNVEELKKALDELIRQFSQAPAGVLFPVPAKQDEPPNTANKKQAQDWIDAMGSGRLVYLGGDNYCVMIDLSALDSMVKRLDDIPLEEIKEGKVTWNSAQFQSWQTGFNAQGEQLKNELQKLTQKYSSANSTHDNFIKTLSSHMSQFTDMLKAMLNF